VTRVTATRQTLDYLALIGSRLIQMEQEMTKFYALVAALAVFAPLAFATMNQAAQMVA